MTTKRKNLISAMKAFFKSARGSKIPQIALVPEKKNIVNFKQFEIVKESGLKMSVWNKIQKKTALKVWYYINKTEADRRGERVEKFVHIPSSAKKYLGYIEKDTENIFIVARNKAKTDVYAINEGEASFMFSKPSTYTNQEVKKAIAG